MEYSAEEIRAINRLRRSTDVALLRAVAERAASEARGRYETSPASEENRLQAVMSNDVITAIFYKAV